MLTKPDISDELIISRLQEAYGLQVVELTFLPIGADLRTAVYRVVADDGTAYFMKLRRKFKDVIVRVPLFLKENGVQEIIIPYETRSSQHWADFGEYKIIMYPFIEGQDGFERELTDQHRRTIGAAFRKIHTAQVPPELKESIRKETFSTEWRDDMKSYLAQVEKKVFTEPTAARLAEFMKSKQSEKSLGFGQRYSIRNICLSTLYLEPEVLPNLESPISGKHRKHLQRNKELR